MRVVMSFELWTCSITQSVQHQVPADESCSTVFWHPQRGASCSGGRWNHAASETHLKKYSVYTPV